MTKTMEISAVCTKEPKEEYLLPDCDRACLRKNKLCPHLNLQGGTLIISG